MWDPFGGYSVILQTAAKQSPFVVLAEVLEAADRYSWPA